MMPMRNVSVGRATLAGFCASLVGIGLARFGYTPLIPALIGAGWFAASDVVYLGAANFVGYLVGALLGRTVAARAPAALMLRAMMLVTTAGFFACAMPLSFTWFFLWRFTAGLAGGILMVLAAPTLLPHVPPERRGLAGGVIFTGVGLGIAGSGTLVPLLARLGVVEAWCGLGAVALVLTIVSWGGWPDEPPRPQPKAAEAARAAITLLGSRGLSHVGPALRALYVEYAVNAVGLVPHMVFLVDFVARGLGRGLAAGASYWVCFGIGAMIGPVASGAVADRIGFARALVLAYLLQMAAVATPIVTTDPLWFALSSVVVGAFTPGITTLVLGRVRELVPHDAALQRSAWGIATIGFAAGQGGGAYFFSYLFAQSQSYVLLFEIGVAAIAASLVIDLAASVRRHPSPLGSRRNIVPPAAAEALLPQDLGEER
ncbi:MAG: YbfB/YjiJ family MFS transporter [Alphaproteobacteria bacterium]|nr:YbfB/YjiJ family MFS transporter [Alphaproteobacteria bacterium]